MTRLRLTRLLAAGLLAALWMTAGAWADASSEAWNQAEALYAAGQYPEALKAFSDLAEATKGDTEATARALTRMGDCIQVGGVEGVGSPDEAYALALEQGYSPYLAGAFCRWRAAFQAFHHGVSNFSEIPTAKYNARKERVLAVIAAYRALHPNDPVARSQHTFLRQLQDIIPGGPMGSSVLNEMALLWPEMLHTVAPPQDDYGGYTLEEIAEAVAQVESTWANGR